MLTEQDYDTLHKLVIPIVLFSISPSSSYINFDLTVIYANHAFLDTYVQQDNHLVGKTFSEVFPYLASNDYFLSKLRESLVNQKALNIKIRADHDTQDKHTYYDIDICYMEQDDATTLLCTISRILNTDNIGIYDLRSKEMKNTFLANMSHELRTPLHTIIGMTDLLLETKVNETQQDYLEIMKTAQTNLISIIEDILDFSKLEAYKLKLNITPFHLSDCISSAIDSIRFLAIDKNIEITSFIHPNVPSILLGDGKRIGQILTNLLSNGIKFTDTGTVHVQVNASPTETSNVHQITFHIQDTGIGIDPQDTLRLFQSFTQLDQTNTKTHQGTGLGLSICKRLCELMQGTISVKSTKHIGSTFTVSLPLQSISLSNSPSSGLNDKKVLILDNNQHDRFFLMRQLLQWNIQPTLCNTPQEVMALIQYTSFQLVFIDHDTVKQWGIQFIQEFRKVQKHVCPIVLMGYDFIQSSVSLYDSFLLKPIKPEILHQVVTSHLFNESVTQDSSIIRVLQNPYQFTFLIAEDFAYNQKTMMYMLQTMGYKSIDLANNGQEAINLLAAKSYDVLLLDIKMPFFDGYQVMATIQNHPHKPYTIAITADAYEHDREKCLQSGMNDFLTKPLHKQELQKAIDRMIQHKMTTQQHNIVEL